MNDARDADVDSHGRARGAQYGAPCINFMFKSEALDES
jgi:hypothetical protein